MPLTSAFDLSESLAAKADPELIGADDDQLSAVAASMTHTIRELSERLESVRKAPARAGEMALERDMEVHRLTSRLRTLHRFGPELCLGRMVGTDSDPVYVGRLGLTDSAGRRLLVDWRSPAAEPFFAATHANPMRLTSRRRYRWTNGRVTDYWDEVFTDEELASNAALDDQSAFIASLGSTRSERMRDVLGTIQADQDAIIRAGSSGALVVDGGPGTGKTVVALHRTAYLLYSDPRLGQHRGGVLFVGPHQPYLDYVADVLPNLGEEDVRICTLRDLVAEGTTAGVESNADVVRLKSSAELVHAIERAVRLYEEPPAKGMVVETDWSDIPLSTEEWAEAFDVVGVGIPHNEARELIVDELVMLLVDKDDSDADPEQLRTALERHRELHSALNSAWPLVEATDLVADLWTVPAYLRMCAPWLTADEIRLLQRENPQAWTTSDLPLLDAARRRLGDSGSAERTRRQRASLAAHQADMTRVIDDLIAADDSEMLVMSMLRSEDLRNALDEEVAIGSIDQLAGPFAHIVVDEAQELTDAEWQMVIARCPSMSVTIVGDRAQARRGFTESWRERLERVGFDRIDLATLTVNYRTPAEIMTEAEPVIRAVLPDANVPMSIRGTGRPVVHAARSQLSSVLDDWLVEHVDRVACVIGDASFEASSRVGSLTPELAKGLEFDLVVLVEPAAFGDGIEGAVDHYVAMTRATQQLIVLTS